MLGGGGLTGAAWLTGVLAAFEAARIPIGAADLVLGTSAGSVVGTQVVGGRSFAKQYRFLGAERVPARELLVRLYRAAPKPSPEVLEQLGAQLLDAPASTEAARAIEGRAALAADTMPWPAWLALVALYLRRLRWPGPALAITAVDAESGRLRVFRGGDRVPVAQAVAASSAVPQFFPPVRIRGRRYMDGGTRSVTNADLAAGYDLVLLFIDHRALPGGMGPLSRAALDAEIEGLRAGGATVVEVSPDDASLDALGDLEALDPDRLGPSARAGRAQGGGRGGAGRGGVGGARLTGSGWVSQTGEPFKNQGPARRPAERVPEPRGRPSFTPGNDEEDLDRRPPRGRRLSTADASASGGRNTTAGVRASRPQLGRAAPKQRAQARRSSARRPRQDSNLGPAE